MLEMAINYTNIFHSKTLKNVVIGMLGNKLYNLATLVPEAAVS
jgi:hypothetical protein